MLERIDGLDAELNTAEDNLSKAKAETESVRTKVNQDVTSLKEQLQSVLRDLEVNEKKLPGDVYAEYRRLVENRGEDALAETDLQTCGQCYTKITTQKVSELMMKMAVFCPSCGSLMYIGETQTTVS